MAGGPKRAVGRRCTMMIHSGGCSTSRNVRVGRWGAGLALIILGFGFKAQPACADDMGPSARAVRLSSVDGQVRVTQGNQTISNQAVANMPLFEGTQVATGQDGRAEIQFEDGSVARIAPDSALTLSVLRGQGANGQAEIVLNGGLGYFELQGGDQAGQIRVRFADAVVTAGGFTVMRVDMDTPPGQLAVFSGNAHLERGEALTLDLHGGESVTLNGGDTSQYDLAESIEPNSWDQWNSDRDQALSEEAADRTQATNDYSNSENPAWNDLDANGNWYDVPGQGYVWSPFVAANAGWDPYGCGQWVWMPAYGYIWVSCESWGFMPYQCGTWNYFNAFGWGWSPGFGGCNAWWGTGYLGPNIGIAPSGYRTVLRPTLQRFSPSRRYYPVISVNREPRGGFPGGPLRSRDAPVTIAGHVVQPLRPVTSRSDDGNPVQGFVYRPAESPGLNGQAPGSTQSFGNRQGYIPAPREGFDRSGRSAPESSRSYSPPPQRSYNPPPAPRSYSPPSYSAPSRPSGGGGEFHGGGAPAGGGGGSHGGGGGGGGHH